jgi:hypothetical protein
LILSNQSIMKIFISSTFLLFFLFSCSKKDEPATIIYPEENPLQGFLNATGYNEKIYNPGAPYSNFSVCGFSFKPVVNGKINSVYLRIYQTGINTKVKIWDVALKTPIWFKDDFYSFDNGNKGSTMNIDLPLNLIKEKEYMITMITKSHYTRLRNDDLPATYPVKSGNLLITGAYFESYVSDLLLPKIKNPNGYFGDVSFNFQRTE